MNEPQKSVGHIAFVGAFEYYIGAEGDLYRADKYLPIMPDGRRWGRWEAPAWLVKRVLEALQTAGAQPREEM